MSEESICDTGYSYDWVVEQLCEYYKIKNGNLLI